MNLSNQNEDFKPVLSLSERQSADKTKTPLRRRISQNFGLYTSFFKILMKANRRFGFDSVPHMDVFGDEDPAFMTFFKTARQRSLLSQDKLFILNQCARQAGKFSGDWAELGVFQGGSAFLLSKIISEKSLLHLFDTFSGNPRMGEFDSTAVGDFSNTNIESVAGFINNSSVVFHKGDVLHTLEQVSSSKFSFIHFDLDVYESTVASLEFFYPRMKQGIMVFDDYPIPGIKKAINEFFSSRSEIPIPQRTGQCLVLKM